MKKYEPVNYLGLVRDEMIYHKGESHDKEERVEATVTLTDGRDWLHINVRNLAGGLTKYTTERGFSVELPMDDQLEILQYARNERNKILAAYPVKTYAGWSESGLGNFSDYCQPGDEVDEKVVDYFLNVVPPASHRSDLIQCGEPYSHELDEKGKLRATFTTFAKLDGVWHYMGECFVGGTVHRTKTPRGIDRAIKTLIHKIQN
jgi:hypothetical protein